MEQWLVTRALSSSQRDVTIIGNRCSRGSGRASCIRRRRVTKWSEFTASAWGTGFITARTNCGEDVVDRVYQGTGVQGDTVLVLHGARAKFSPRINVNGGRAAPTLIKG